jgi:hypothetical protein
MVSRCKLILVEGVPGSGKTAQAAWIKDYLDEKGIPNRLYLEGNPEHPADFESVAWFTPPQYQALLSRYPAQRPALERNAFIRGEDCFIGYGALRPDDGHPLPPDLLRELAAQDVYEIPSAETYCQLALARWREFVDRAMAVEGVWIFECCFMQNPLTVLIGKHGVPVQAARAHIGRLAAAVRPLQPALIFLLQRYILDSLDCFS